MLMGPEMREPPRSGLHPRALPGNGPRRRRVYRFTRKRSSDAALSVLGPVGMGRVIDERVAQELRTGAASLYGTCANKERTFPAGLSDRVTREVVLPSPTPPTGRKQLKLLAYEMRQGSQQARDVARISFGRVPTGPQMALAHRMALHAPPAVGILTAPIAYIGDVAVFTSRGLLLRGGARRLLPHRRRHPARNKSSRCSAAIWSRYPLKVPAHPRVRST